MPTTTTTSATVETVALPGDATAVAATATAEQPAPAAETTPVYNQRDNSWAPVGCAATPVDPVGPEGYGRVGLLTKRPAPELDEKTRKMRIPKKS